MQLTLDARSAFVYHGPAQSGHPTLLLIHGGGLDQQAWLPVIHRLESRGVGVFAPDLPGHGRSGGMPMVDIEAMAAWIMQLLDHVAIPVTTLAGHSMGSLVALECAGRDGSAAATGGPARIARLVLLATGFPMHVSDALLDAAVNDEPKAQEMVNAWSHAIPRAGDGAIGEAMAAAMAHNLANMQRQRHAVLHADLLACARYSAGFESAARVRCPTLLLLGEKDRMTPPRSADALAAALRAGVETQVVTLPATGHNMMAENPDAVAHALLAARP